MYELEILQTIIKLETTDNTTIIDIFDIRLKQLNLLTLHSSDCIVGMKN